MQTVQSFKPEGFNSIFNYLIVVDAQKSIDFYTKALDFKLGDTMSQEGQLVHVELKNEDGSRLMFCPANTGMSKGIAPILTPDAPVSPITLCLYHADVDASHAAAVAAGAISILAPKVAEWAPNERYCIFQDINGYTWMILTMKA